MCGTPRRAPLPQREPLTEQRSCMRDVDLVHSWSPEMSPLGARPRQAGAHSVDDQ